MHKYSTAKPERILFLTSQLGYGHIKAAKAVEEELKQKMPKAECHYLDLWSLMDTKVADAVRDGYLRMTREHPDWYQKLYDMDADFYQQLSGRSPLAEGIKNFLREHQNRWYPEEKSWLPRKSGDLDKAMINSLIRLLCLPEDRFSQKIQLVSLLVLIRTVLLKRMREKINAIKPDVIVATQMYPAALLSALKKRNNFREIPTLAIVTDFGLQNVWVRGTTDIYCVATEQMVQHLRAQGVERDQIHVTGIPLEPEFQHPPTQVQARKQLGLAVDRPTLLVTGGQYGIGIVDAVRSLLTMDASYQVMVTAGDSENRAELEDLQRQHSDRLLVFKWVTNMSNLLAAADLVVGKPGGLSVSEALACGRPFFATCCLGGQEKHNLDFLEANEIGRLLKPHEIPLTLDKLFRSPEILHELQQRACALGNPDSANHVASLVAKLAREAPDRRTAKSSVVNYRLREIASEGETSL